MHSQYADLGRREARLLRSLMAWDPNRWSNVCTLLDEFTFGPHFCLVMEFIPSAFCSIKFRQSRAVKEDVTPSGDNPVSSFEKLQNSQLIDDIRRVAFKILTSLGFLRWTNIIHADLKPENILITVKSIPNGETTARAAIDEVKIIDFGNAFFDTFHDVVTFYDDFELQSPLYRAPEVFFGVAGFDAAIDVWSLGAILAEFFLGKPIFEGETTEEILGAMISILGPLPKQYFRKGAFYEKYSGFTEGKPEPLGIVIERLCNVMGTRDRVFVDFIARCLIPVPSKRLTPTQASLHPFLAPVCPMAYFAEPHSINVDNQFGRTTNDGIPYVATDLPREYDLKPMKPVEALNTDPTFVRSLDEERVDMASKGKVIINRGKKLPDAEKETLAPNVSFTSQLCESLESTNDDDDISDEEEERDLNRSVLARHGPSALSGITASQIMAQLEREERRLDEAEKNQVSLKRKATDLHLRTTPSRTTSTSEPQRADTAEAPSE